MSRTFIRQDAQISQSLTYDDTVVPTQANYETVRPDNIEDDLNSVRSQVQNVLNRNGGSFPSGKWYDNIAVPSALETGIQRGVSKLNDALHLIEKKRILRDVFHIDPDITVPSSALATGSLSLAGGNFGNNETVTIGTTVYTFKLVLTPANWEVLVGATPTDSRDNLQWAINNTGGHPGKFQVPNAHPDVTASAAAGPSLVATAKLGGTQGNHIVTTTTAVGGPVWGAGALTGGDGDMVILGALELPTQTASAPGLTTTLGTVTAYLAAFGDIALTEVAGSNTMNPRNLCNIEDSTTGDPVISGEREVYGLFQAENAGDPDTMTDTTPHRVQISFVRPNATFDDLEYCPAADIAGKTIHYSTRERVRLEDLNEEDFLKGAVIDIGAGAVTPTRQVGYDDQGVTPVNLLTNAYLNLGSGLEWDIRDLLGANLLKILEGSGGATSRVQIAADTDFFDVNAADNDFLNGIKVDTGAAGTTIQIGVTPNQIDSGGGLTVASGGGGDLKLNSAGEILFNDLNRTGSTWVGTSVKLTDTTAEWSQYKTDFGEVSIFNALHQAVTTAKRTKGYAKLVANVAAGLDVDKTTTNRLNVDLPSFAGAGTFVDDVDVYLNGELLQNEAAYPGLHDVAPGSTPAQGMLKFEFALHGVGAKPDQLCMIVWNS